MTGKGVWITELGRPSETENYTEETQASYLVNGIVGVYPEVERVFVYELYDYTDLEPPKENYFGLLTLEYEKKPAYHSLKELNDSWVEETGSEP